MFKFVNVFKLGKPTLIYKLLSYLAKKIRSKFKIILLGIISKVCLAETLSKTDRHVSHDDEIASVSLSVKSSPVPLLLSQ